ncbi:MAG TPA: winged helix DNA-binding domain-containing protein [Streptosporangiaceae bacterium]
MAAEVLSRRALNRALLDRQLLLRRVALPDQGEGRAATVIETVEHLGGLQAQAPFPPYYGLWSRLAGFRPDDLAGLITSRRVVRIALMRGTIHLVSARDCLILRPLVQPVLDRALTATFGRQLAGVDTGELAAAGRALVEAEPRTFSELGALLAPRWPGHSPDALAQGVRALVPLIQVPPRAVWGSSGLARHTAAESWLGQPVSQGASLEGLVERYLGAFGPASVRDIQTWSGLTRLREVTDRLGDRLRKFRSEDGTELLDLPEAPRPGPDTPAPVRLIAEFDNLILSHADRSRVMSEEARQRMFTRNGVFPGSVLVNGFLAAIWRITRSSKAITLTLEPFGDLSSKIKDEIGGEAGQMLTFAAPGAEHDIRFVPAP